MKPISAKISFILLILVLFSSCNAVKRVEKDENLLVENTIYVDGEKENKNLIYELLYQRPNTDLLGYPLELHVYNLAKPEPDSAFTTWLHAKPDRKENLADFYSEKQVVRMGNIYLNFNQWLKKVGEAPVIVEEDLTQKSAERLKAWYWNKGWFDTETSYEIIPRENKRAAIEYFVTKHEPYIVDSIKTRIPSEAADSIYERYKQFSYIKSGTQFSSEDFSQERERLTTLFRNNGLYHFEQEYLTFEADTIGTDHKVNATVIVQNHETIKSGVTTRIPYQVHKISEVNIFPDYTYENRNDAITDTATYNGYHIYAFDPLKYRPKALTNAIFIAPDSIYSDTARTLTYNRLSQLRIFKYPDIQYMPDPNDSTNTNLIANIFLTALPKYSLEFQTDISQS
ncbi:MAG TPA: outer membrane protein assembly factor, partial [Salinimicrobium sp.]|nr:outer membrane protein assembly factor [Salinimicrobium sp.]